MTKLKRKAGTREKIGDDKTKKKGESDKREKTGEIIKTGKNKAQKSEKSKGRVLVGLFPLS